MKRVLFSYVLMFIGLVSAMAQTIPYQKEEPATPSFIQYGGGETSIQWEENGMGYATISLPFSLNNTIDLAMQISLVYRYNVRDNTLEFTFYSPTPPITHITLQFEDQNYSYTYVDTPTGPSLLPYKWKYVIDVYFK